MNEPIYEERRHVHETTREVLTSMAMLGGRK
jgi:hypothetical protein